MRKTDFKNDAADKIWSDHLGNNAYVRHRDDCSTCLQAYRARSSKQDASCPDCPEGAQIFDAMLDEVLKKIDEALLNQN